jgi:hypothetical protein
MYTTGGTQLTKLTQYTHITINIAATRLHSWPPATNIDMFFQKLPQYAPQSI